MISGAVGPGDHEQDTSSIWQVSILGGTPRQLRDDAYRAELSPDDSNVAYMTRNEEIWLADADGENPRPLVEEPWAPGGVGSPKWSPDGHRVIYRRLTREEGLVVQTIESRSLDEPSSTVLVREDVGGAWWNSTGGLLWGSDLLMLDDRLVYVRSEPPPRGNDVNLWEVAIDPRTGKPAGEPKRLTDWVGYGPAVLSATADGSQLAFVNGRNQTDVFVADLAEGGWALGNTRRLTLDDRNDDPECWMPDSRAVVFRSNRYGSDDLLVQGLDDRNARELVVGAGDQGFPQRTPDGKFFLYWELGKSASDALRLLRIPVGGGPAELVLEAPPPAFVGCATTPDGPCQLLEVHVDEDVMTVSRLDPLNGKGQELIPASRLPAPSDVSSAALSPDGRTTAWSRRSEPTVHLRGEVERDIEISAVPVTDLTDIAWSPDGNGFFITGESARGILLLRVDMQGEAKVLYEVGTGDLSSPRPSPDGRRIAFRQETWDANVWMIERF